MSESVRDRVTAIQRYLRDEPDDITPGQYREMAVELSALLGNVNAEVLEAEMDYNAVLLQCYSEEKTSNRAKLKAETTPEYRRFRTAKDVQKLVTTMRSTLNTVLRSLQEEMRLGA